MTRTSYCRAYLLEDLRRFPGWERAAGPAARELAGDAVVYVQDDLGVVADPLAPEDGPLLDPAGLPDGWARFCADELDFTIPEDLIDD